MLTHLKGLHTTGTPNAKKFSFGHCQNYLPLPNSSNFKFRDQDMVNKGPHNSARGLPPPPFGQCPKNFFAGGVPKVFFSGNCLVFGSCQSHLPSRSGNSFLPYNLRKIYFFWEQSIPKIDKNRKDQNPMPFLKYLQNRFCCCILFQDTF